MAGVGGGSVTYKLALTQYKNLDVTPGIACDFRFDIIDDTFLRVDLTGFTYKLEIFDNNAVLVLGITDVTSFDLGYVIMPLTLDQSVTLQKEQYNYRLVIIPPTGNSSLAYQGFVTCKAPMFDVNLTTSSSVIILPNGTIYSTVPIIITPGLWYSLGSYSRFLVSEVGRTSIDGKNTIGEISVNVTYIDLQYPDQVEWNPGLVMFNSFRINKQTGNNVIQYLP